MASSLVEQYEKQDRWREWDLALSLCPIRSGQRVLDLGCGVGQVSERLSRLGAEVIGVDIDQKLLDAARDRAPDVWFEQCELNELAPATFGKVDGLWSSFVPAYFPDLSSLVKRWAECLKRNGWFALVEMEDLLGHGPLPTGLREEIERFYCEARDAGRYNFRAGAHLADALRGAGLRLIREELLPDLELSANGPLTGEVLTAWQLRLGRMGGLKNFFGARYPEVERAFLAALTSENHVSSTRVHMVVGIKD